VKSCKRNMEKYKVLHLEISKRLKKAEELGVLFSKHESLTGTEMQIRNRNKIKAYRTIVKLLKRRIVQHG